MLPTRGSAERREGEKERRTEGGKKKVRHSYTQESARTQYSERRRQALGRTQRAVGSEPSSSVNERAVWDTHLSCADSADTTMSEMLETNMVTALQRIRKCRPVPKGWFSLTSMKTLNMTRHMQRQV